MGSRGVCASFLPCFARCVSLRSLRPSLSRRWSGHEVAVTPKLPTAPPLQPTGVLADLSAAVAARHIVHGEPKLAPVFGWRDGVTLLKMLLSTSLALGGTACCCWWALYFPPPAQAAWEHVKLPWMLRYRRTWVGGLAS
eukprot:GHVT01067438.1.p2 GENE.GHVT01067438.1~~GHVT01067438.1.p2  ORF type:complete len:139 (+),score=12.11 GHVT01067438.1:889-1305(+)